MDTSTGMDIKTITATRTVKFVLATDFQFCFTIIFFSGHAGKFKIFKSTGIYLKIKGSCYYITNVKTIKANELHCIKTTKYTHTHNHSNNHFD